MRQQFKLKKREPLKGPVWLRVSDVSDLGSLVRFELEIRPVRIDPREVDRIVQTIARDQVCNGYVAAECTGNCLGEWREVIIGAHPPIWVKRWRARRREVCPQEAAHEYTPDNTRYRRRNGLIMRVCMTCARNAINAHYAKNKDRIQEQRRKKKNGLHRS